MRFWQNLNTVNRLQGIILLIIAAILWSSSGFFIKLIDWNPLAIAGARSFIAAIVIRVGFHHSKFCWSKPTLYGAIAYAAMMLNFVAATKLTTAANAILLQYTAPIYIAILSTIFLKEKPHLYDWLTITAVAGGMILFFQDQLSSGALLGNILAIASGISMAVTTVSLRYQKDNSPFGSVLLGNIITFICGLPFMFDSSPGLTGYIALVGLGCFQLGFSYMLYTIAIKSVPALEASIITMIEPLLNPLWVFLFLGEIPGFWSLVGGALILTAIMARYIMPAIKSPSKKADISN